MVVILTTGGYIGGSMNENFKSYIDKWYDKEVVDYNTYMLGGSWQAYSMGPPFTFLLDELCMW